MDAILFLLLTNKNTNQSLKYNKPEQSITFNDEYAFIILSPVEYADELDDLVIHKNNIGIKTKLVTLDEIFNETYFPTEGRDNQEKIKYFIKNAIEQWNIYYALLVGCYQAFPTRLAIKDKGAGEYRARRPAKERFARDFG